MLRFYLVYRAMVRAKIDMIRLHDRTQSAAQKRVLLNEFGEYVSIAKHDADHDAQRMQPSLLIMHGLSGSGKTAVSHRIVEESQTIRIRSDIERKRLHGIAETDRVSGAAVDRLYSPHATRRTYSHLASLATTVIEAGFPVIVDATFLQAEERVQFRKLARKLEVPFRIIACTASEDELLARVSARAANDHDASDAGLAVLRNQLLIKTDLEQEPMDELIIVDTSNKTSVNEALKSVLAP